MSKACKDIFLSTCFLRAALALGIVGWVSGMASPFAHAETAATPAGGGELAMPASGSSSAAPAAMPINPSADIMPATPPPIVMPPAVSSSNGSAEINLPAPPPATAFSNNPAQIEQQAQTVSSQAALQAQAQAQAEADQLKKEQEHNLKSYDRAAMGLLPLSPDQVREFMHRLEQTQDAAIAPYAGPPNGQVRISTLSLSPGVEPPQVNLASGYVTTITLVDSTGEPWPILDVGVGGNFEVTPTQAGSHVIRIMPLTRVGTGDLSVLLKDLPTPVIFRLSAGGPTVDLRYDARIPKFGPGGKPPLINRPRLEAGNESIMMILQNAPPDAAKRMKISGIDARTMAWSLDNHVYVRTPLTLLSPAWDASVSSADGMTVYEIGDAPVLLMSDNGAVVRAHLLRDDDHDK